MQPPSACHLVLAARRIYRLQQAASLLRAGEASSALEAVEAILTQQGPTADALVVRGATHTKLGNTIQARADFLHALKLDDAHSDAAQYLAKVSAAPDSSGSSQ